MMQQPKIASIVTRTPNPTIDLSFRSNEIRPIRKTRAIEERTDPRGGGTNVARVLKELGVEAYAIYRDGGATGLVLKELVAELELPGQCIDVAGRTRTSFAVFEEIVPLSKQRGNRPDRSSKNARFPSQLNNVLIYVLLGAGFIKLMLNPVGRCGNHFSASSSERAGPRRPLDAIRNMLSRRRDAPCLRRIPADMRLAEAKNLRTEEAALSVAADKNTDAVSDNSTVGDGGGDSKLGHSFVG